MNARLHLLIIEFALSSNINDELVTYLTSQLDRTLEVLANEPGKLRVSVADPPVHLIWETFAQAEGSVWENVYGSRADITAFEFEDQADRDKWLFYGGNKGLPVFTSDVASDSTDIDLEMRLMSLAFPGIKLKG